MGIRRTFRYGPFVAGLPEITLFPDKESRKRAMRKANRRGIWYFVVLGLFIIVVTRVAGRIASMWSAALGDSRGVELLFFSLLGCAAVAAFGTVDWFWLRPRIEKRLREELIRLGVAVCMECGYDLRGQTEQRCPECGREFDVAMFSIIENAAQTPPCPVARRPR